MLTYFSWIGEVKIHLEPPVAPFWTICSCDQQLHFHWWGAKRGSVHHWNRCCGVTGFWPLRLGWRPLCSSAFSKLVWRDCRLEIRIGSSFSEDVALGDLWCYYGSLGLRGIFHTAGISVGLRSFWLGCWCLLVSVMAEDREALQLWAYWSVESYLIGNCPVWFGLIH